MKARVNGNAELTVDQVRMIRFRVDNKEATAGEIARELRMSAEAIRKVARRETWAWVPEAPTMSEQALKEASAASQARLLRLLSGEEQPRDETNGPQEEKRSLAQKMAMDALEARRQEAEKALKGDKMLEELNKGDKDGSGSKAG